MQDSIDLETSQPLEDRKKQNHTREAKSMNYSKGFTRIWLALSLGWIFSVACYHFESIINPKITPYYYLYSANNEAYVDVTSESDLVRKLTKNRSYETHDTLYSEHYIFASSDRVAAVEAMNTQLRNEDVSLRKVQYNEARTNAIMSAVLYSVIPVIVLLVIGLSIPWVLAGFKRKQQPKRLW
jgi:hypothetical protein